MHYLNPIMRERFAEPVCGSLYARRLEVIAVRNLSGCIEFSTMGSDLSREQEATPPPNPLYALLFLAGFDTCQIRQRLPALGQVL